MANKDNDKVRKSKAMMKAITNNKSYILKSTDAYKIASNQQYIKAGIAVEPLLGRQRYNGMQRFDECKKYASVAQAYCKEVWTNELKKHYKNMSDSTLFFGNNFEMPNSMLTKKGNIPAEYAKVVLDKLQNTFDMVDDCPFLINDSLIGKLIKTPKKVVAQMKMNGVGKHSRSCYIIRQLLECKIDDHTYLMTLDSKYYQNSPSVAYSLNLLVNGMPNGIAQISRIDSVGHLGPDFLAENKIFDVKIPDYLIEKINCVHNNTTPSKKNHVSREKVSGANHMHIRSEAFGLLYALSHMAKTCTYRTNPKEYLKYNAKEISDSSFYTDDLSDKSFYMANIDEFAKAYNANIDAKLFDAKNNAGVIRTELLSKFANKKFNIEDSEISPEFSKYMDKLRIYEPKRVGKVIHLDNINECDNNQNGVLSIRQSDSSKLYTQALGRVGKLVDLENDHTIVKQTNPTNPNM